MSEAADFSRPKFLRQRADMQIETVRHAVAKLQRGGQTVTLAHILGWVEESFITGAQCMADAIQIEMNSIYLEERDQREQLARAGVLVEMTDNLHG